MKTIANTAIVLMIGEKYFAGLSQKRVVIAWSLVGDQRFFLNDEKTISFYEAKLAEKKYKTKRLGISVVSAEELEEFKQLHEKELEVQLAELSKLPRPMTCRKMVSEKTQ